VIRIAIAEELTITRWALREALSRIPDMEVVGEAGTVDEVREMLHRVKPDILLLDLTLPDHAGADVLAELRELDWAPHVVLLAAHVAPAFVARAMTAGAHGCVSKGAQPEQFLDAIRSVHRGERVVPPEIEALLAGGDGHRMLTKREQQVMEMLARGMTNREVAEHLVISSKTVDTHRGHILKKLGLRNNSDMTRFAVRNGYVTL
jgi:DNA-binding NarL/FixJ family response regulator